MNRDQRGFHAVRWFRLYDDLLDDPKIQRLAPHLFRTWINVLCLASKNNGSIPNDDDVAFRLRISVQEAATQFQDLILAGLVDIDAHGRRSPHNWSGRQYASDSSAERTRNWRAKGRVRRRDGAGDVTRDSACDVTRDGGVTVQNQTQIQTQNRTIVPGTKTVTRDTATTRVTSDEQNFGFGSGTGSDGVRFEKLLRQAEGLGLPVDELVATVNRNRPKNRRAYFTTLAVNRLAAVVPTVPERELRAAIWGDERAFGLVSQAILAMEAT